MGMGIKSLKWEGIGTKNLFPHTSTSNLVGIIDVGVDASDILSRSVRQTNRE